MIEDPYSPPVYPFIRFIVRFGMYVALACGLLCLGGGALVAHALGSALWLAAGLLVAILVGGAIASYVEVLRIISDTLIPR